MEVKELPTYTAEKYYLLSEIEQRSTFLFADGDTKLDEVVTKSSVSAIYVLWDAEVDTSATSLKDKIRNIIRFSSFSVESFSDSLLAIEVVSTSHPVRGCKNLSTKLHGMLEEVAKWAVDTYDVGLVVLGVANDGAATPALSKACDFVTKFSDTVWGGPYHATADKKKSLSLEEAVDLNVCVRFIAEHKADFLGHAADRDPEAKNNVWQRECLYVAAASTSIADQSVEAVEKAKNSDSRTGSSKGEGQSYFDWIAGVTDRGKALRARNHKLKVTYEVKREVSSMEPSPMNLLLNIFAIVLFMTITAYFLVTSRSYKLLCKKAATYLQESEYFCPKFNFLLQLRRLPQLKCSDPVKAAQKAKAAAHWVSLSGNEF